MNRKPGTRWTSLATALLVAVALTTGAAFAHVKDETAILFDEQPPYNVGQCVKGLARVADGNYDKGFARSTTSSFANSTEPCTPDKAKGAGRIAAGMWWYKWHSGQNAWLICVKFGYYYNNSVASGLTVYHDFHHIKCAHGDYATLSGNYVWWKDRWRGGQLFSPSHYF
jgi:hypothetical protein